MVEAELLARIAGLEEELQRLRKTVSEIEGRGWASYVAYRQVMLVMAVRDEDQRALLERSLTGAINDFSDPQTVGDLNANARVAMAVTVADLQQAFDDIQALDERREYLERLSQGNLHVIVGGKDDEGS